MKKILDTLKKSKSLLSKYLTPAVYDCLKDRKTSSSFTLEDAIRSGLENLDSSIGVYAGDEESYSVFSPLFDGIIKEYHDFNQDAVHTTNLNPNDLYAPSLKEDEKYILSTRMRVGRNLQGFPLGTIISKSQRAEVEYNVSSSLKKLQGDLRGKYYPLATLSEEDRKILIENHFLFKAGDRFLESAGLNRDWPNNRGIFHNENKNFLVWINEEDHIRIISMQQGGDIKEVFSRLSKALDMLQEDLHFAFNNHLGFITSCPTNLGTALRASVHIKLPHLGKRMKAFEELANKYSVQIRGIHGEHSQSNEGIYDISNKRRLGLTEVACVQDMYNGIRAMIQREKELEAIS